MKQLEQDLIRKICEVCKIQDPLVEIDPNAPLIGPESQLGIDSLDAVEIIFTVHNDYNVRIGTEETSRQVLTSLKSLADFIRNNSKNIYN